MSAYEKVLDLSYGENPHQRAAYYAEVGSRMHVLSMVRQLGGKELSFNNVLDLNGARALVDEFELPACAIIKHNNPCGCAVGVHRGRGLRARLRLRPAERVRRGRVPQPPGRRRRRRARSSSSSPRSSSRPKFTEEALEILAAKPKMRILEDNERRRPNIGERDLKRVVGGLLVQDRDIDLEDRSAMQVVTERKPTEAEWGEMLFAWKVCKHVRSNAIVVSHDLAAVGIGAGQMSRVDSVRIAVEKATGTRGDLAGGALASDAFFPFADGPQLAIDAGRALRHPAGRLDARPRGRRGRGRGRRGDGLHRPPALQALRSTRRTAPGRSWPAARRSLRGVRLGHRRVELLVGLLAQRLQVRRLRAGHRPLRP